MCGWEQAAWWAVESHLLLMVGSWWAAFAVRGEATTTPAGGIHRLSFVTVL